ncbi:hemolysin family protein [Rhizobium sp. RM]|uniref:hemolysin family protein n=1 Tax=Rhizobium/Agrobacterium group TaxID=227290 RepID=UPI00110E3EB9|nr:MULTISPECIES: hemolysin family protein [Rhizobium/Agrobacterium group]NWJ24669.1 HlyC/CorC family transporter [Rhizobium sp. RM]TMV16473.1 HlyC/CorC family transporter [Rhizobium sp. Td3]UXS00015.1 HlyC/CorC family transporter [Agrobacterium tumefaciens]
MNEHSARPANEGRENGEQSSSEEGSSQLRYDFSAKPRSTIWSRIARLLKPSQGERLREDITDALMSDTEIGAAFSPEERAMLNNILRFREVRVEDIMIPRVDIDGIDQNMTIGEALILFEETGRSRMPVYDENLDNPKGMIHIRDLLSYVAKQARNKRRIGTRIALDTETNAARTPRPNFDLARVDLEISVANAGLVRKILFAPPSMLASDLLKTMQAQRTQLALVIDEYGGTDGLVSHEDIVEMVVGDIDDEHDKDEAMFSRLSADVLVADARAELTELSEAIGPEFDVREHVEEIDTLGGLIFFALGRIPAKGETVRAIPGFEFQILDADSRRIKGVRIVRDHGSEGQDDRAPDDAEPDEVMALPAPETRQITH